MMNETPEAALRSRIADLEQQLRLADEGTSRLAQRCLELEKQLQTFYAVHPQKEMQADSPALVQPLLYFDAGFGFSQRDTVKAPDYEYDEMNGMVTATFELPEAAVNLRFDPGELPCCITNFVFSDDRILCRPVNGVPLHGDGILFLNDDPNFMLEGMNRFPAGMKLGVSYGYFPLEALAGDPLFAAVLEGVQYFQKTRVCEQKHLDQLEKTSSDQKQTIEALQKNISELHQANAELTARSRAYENSLENVLRAGAEGLAGSLPARPAPPQVPAGGGPFQRESGQRPRRAAGERRSEPDAHGPVLLCGCAAQRRRLRHQ